MRRSTPEFGDLPPAICLRWLRAILVFALVLTYPLALEGQTEESPPALELPPPVDESDPDLKPASPLGTETEPAEGQAESVNASAVAKAGAVAAAATAAPVREVTPGQEEPVPEPGSAVPANAVPAPPPLDRGPEVKRFTPDPPVITLRTLNNLRFDQLRIVISLREKRLKLLSGGEVAIDTPVTVGVSESSTPTGEYQVHMMSREFYMPDFGDFVIGQDRQVLLSQVDRRYHYLPSGATFQPKPKRFYMQFTHRIDDTPVGLRGGTVTGYAGTRGDVIVPGDVAALLFGSIRRGTPVIVEY